MLQGTSRGYIIKSSREREKNMLCTLQILGCGWLRRYYVEKGGGRVGEGVCMCLVCIFFFLDYGRQYYHLPPSNDKSDHPGANVSDSTTWGCFCLCE